VFSFSKEKRSFLIIRFLHEDKMNKIKSYFRIASSSLSVSDNTNLPETRLNVDHVQNHCHRHSKTYSRKNLDNNYQRVKLENISIIGEQYFVPISSINF